TSPSARSRPEPVIASRTVTAASCLNSQNVAHLIFLPSCFQYTCPMSLVAIDCRFASYHAGLGRYTRELTSALLKRDDPWDYMLLVKDPAESWLRGLPSSPRIVAAPFAHYSFAEQWHLPRVIRESGADLLFSPHFNVPLRSPVPFLITVHDLIL